MGFQRICRQISVPSDNLHSRGGTDKKVSRQQVPFSPTGGRVMPWAPRTSSGHHLMRTRFSSLSPELLNQNLHFTGVSKRLYEPRPEVPTPEPSGERSVPLGSKSAPRLSLQAGRPGAGGLHSPQACCRWCRAWWRTAPLSGGTSWSSRRSASWSSRWPKGCPSECHTPEQAEASACPWNTWQVIKTWVLLYVLLKSSFLDIHWHTEMITRTKSLF